VHQPRSPKCRVANDPHAENLAIICSSDEALAHLAKSIDAVAARRTGSASHGAKPEQSSLRWTIETIVSTRQAGIPFVLNQYA